MSDGPSSVDNGNALRPTECQSPFFRWVESRQRRTSTTKTGNPRRDLLSEVQNNASSAISVSPTHVLQICVAVTISSPSRRIISTALGLTLGQTHKAIRIRVRRPIGCCGRVCRRRGGRTIAADDDRSLDNRRIAIRRLPLTSGADSAVCEPTGAQTILSKNACAHTQGRGRKTAFTMFLQSVELSRDCLVAQTIVHRTRCKDF